MLVSLGTSVNLTLATGGECYCHFRSGGEDAGADRKPSPRLDRSCWAGQPWRLAPPFMPDTVEEVWFEVIAAGGSGVAASPVSAASPQVAAIGDGTGSSMASLRRFWAVAARWNSSRAPFGPRNRSRSSFRMRLRWANSISTFFRWQARGLVGLGFCNVAGQVTRPLVD